MVGTGPSRKHPVFLHRSLVLASLLILLTVTTTLGDPTDPIIGRPVTDKVADAGIFGLNVTNLGYVGNAFSEPNLPSGEYPLNSNVEHLYLAGIWVGASTLNDTIFVSTGAQDASSLNAGDTNREFDVPTGSLAAEYGVVEWSNLQNAPNYHPDALATEHIELAFYDNIIVESGNHTPLGVKVVMRALTWESAHADDFVILDYKIINVSGSDLFDVYLGFWNDTMVGNTELTNPYESGQGPPWNYYDDKNGGWQPGDVAGDPDIWMSYEHDADGDEEMATSWIGTRVLGTVPEPYALEDVAPVSYNVWRFRGVPERDTWYLPVGEQEELPGKYQIMANGEFDVDPPGLEQPVFAVESNWVSLMSTGPFPVFSPGDTLGFTIGLICGADSLSLLENSKVAQLAYDEGFQIPAGPPSPLLDIEYGDDTITLAWAPGDSVGQNNEGEWVPLISDDPRRSPEHHISLITNQPDFQGYRVFRYQGESFTADPNLQATLVAQFDVIDGVGFDTGLPPLGADGKRRFTDDFLLDGFPYWYSIISYSAPNVDEGLPEYPSGFNANAVLVYPGPAPSPVGEGPRVGVFPNPYRAASYFDDQVGEQELGRKIWFTNLPERSRIQIFNLSGDLVTTLDHDDPWEGMEAWDLLSGPQRAIASGLYIYVVEDLATGELQRGKLVIIK